MIKTDRLILRRFTPEDTEDITAINADPQVMKYFPSTMSRDETGAHMQRIMAHWVENNFGLFALEVRDTAQMIGFTGLSIPTYTVPATPCVEVGWRLTSTAWSKG